VSLTSDLHLTSHLTSDLHMTTSTWPLTSHLTSDLSLMLNIMAMTRSRSPVGSDGRFGECSTTGALTHVCVNQTHDCVVQKPYYLIFSANQTFIQYFERWEINANTNTYINVICIPSGCSRHWSEWVCVCVCVCGHPRVEAFKI